MAWGCRPNLSYLNFFCIAFFQLLNVLLANGYYHLRKVYCIMFLFSLIHCIICGRHCQFLYCMLAITKLSATNFLNYVFALQQFAEYHYVNWFVLAQQGFLSAHHVLFLPSSSLTDTSLFLCFITHRSIFTVLFFCFRQNPNYAD